MRFRTLVFATVFVSAFAYVTTRPNSFFRKSMSIAEPLWSGPQVAHSAGLGSDELNNVDVYKASRDCVVSVTSTVMQRNFFFTEQGHAVGSGFLINSEGQILTNFHVISGSSDVEVTLPDQTNYKAKILVRDRQDDLALIKIEPKKKLPHLNLGDSDHLTVGVVSTLGRDIQAENNQTMEGMIQTDAAINSGNSGGPLLDSQGSVIGINTAIYGPNGGSVGIGFASPINRAKLMLSDFSAGKSFGRARLGVSTVPIAGDLADALHLPVKGGLLIQQVTSGSAAAGAGLRGARDEVRVGNQRLGVGGDFITGVDGKQVEEADAVTRALGRKRPGDMLDLTIYRDGHSINVRVKLGEAPEDPM
jgi:S1-C subfamily serine protease